MHLKEISICTDKPYNMTKHISQSLSQQQTPIELTYNSSVETSFRSRCPFWRWSAFSLMEITKIRVCLVLTLWHYQWQWKFQVASEQLIKTELDGMLGSEAHNSATLCNRLFAAVSAISVAGSLPGILVKFQCLLQMSEHYQPLGWWQEWL